MMDHLPVFAVCGYSGAGKTTLVEEVARRLSARGLRTAVIKHDAHGPSVDTSGKDSDRFFKAGADVLLHAPHERFFRAHERSDPVDIAALVESMCPAYDVVLVEATRPRRCRTRSGC
jgi:molybdopterin-guanine dinucleotide biosynthesis protein MobB